MEIHYRYPLCAGCAERQQHHTGRTRRAMAGRPGGHYASQLVLPLGPAGCHTPAPVRGQQRGEPSGSGALSGPGTTVSSLTSLVTRKCALPGCTYQDPLVPSVALPAWSTYEYASGAAITL